MVSAAFKIPHSETHENNLFSTGPYASFVGRIYEEVEEQENDCKFGVNLFEYNNFSFANKERMNFKIQVVYESGPDSRFRKLASRLEIGKLVFISGFFDLDENQLPFIEAKEIDLLDSSTNNLSQNQSNTSFKSPFSRTHKFRDSKNVVQSPVKKVKTSNSKAVKIIDDKVDEEMQNNNATKSKEELVIASTSTSEANNQLISEKPKKNNNKRKKELADLSIQRLEKAAKNTKVKTRSQRQQEKELDQEGGIVSEAEEST